MIKYFLSIFIIIVIIPFNLWASDEITCEIKGPFRKIDNVYADIARQTGGQVFNLQPDELGKVDLAPLLMLNDKKKPKKNIADDVASSGIRASGNVLGDDNISQRNGESYESYITKFYKHDDAKDLKASFPIDSTVKKISIKIDSKKKVRIYIKDSFGKNISNSNARIQQLSSSCVIVVKAPEIGDWNIDIKGRGEAEVEVKALSPIDFSAFKWMKKVAGRHGEMLSQEDNPKINNPTLSRAIIYGEKYYDPNLIFLIKDRYGNIFNKINIENFYKEEYFLENSLPSEEEMYIFVKGRDVKGNNFIRRYPFTIRVFK